MIEIAKSAAKNLVDSLVELTPGKIAQRGMERAVASSHAAVILAIVETRFSIAESIGDPLTPEKRRELEGYATPAIVTLVANRHGRDPLVRRIAHRLWTALPPEMIDRSLDIWG